METFSVTRPLGSYFHITWGGKAVDSGTAMAVQIGFSVRSQRVPWLGDVSWQLPASTSCPVTPHCPPPDIHLIEQNWPRRRELTTRETDAGRRTPWQWALTSAGTQFQVESNERQSRREAVLLCCIVTDAKLNVELRTKKRANNSTRFVTLIRHDFENISEGTYLLLPYLLFWVGAHNLPIPGTALNHPGSTEAWNDFAGTSVTSVAPPPQLYCTLLETSWIPKLC
jgi:hypothetical protein